MSRPARILIGAAVLAVVAVACIGGGHSSSPFPANLDPGTADPTGFAIPSDPALVAAARAKIKHIVFLVKENRTFDTMFGTFPGADGATSGQTCDGGTLPLARAKDRTPDAGHSFADGITVIDGGKMDCFAPEGYVQYHRADIPNYWRYASSTCGRSRRNPTGSSITNGRDSSAPDDASSATTRRSWRSRCRSSTAPTRSACIDWRTRVRRARARSSPITGRGGRARTSRSCPTS
jgi:hypothetical protein